VAVYSFSGRGLDKGVGKSRIKVWAAMSVLLVACVEDREVAPRPTVLRATPVSLPSPTHFAFRADRGVFQAHGMAHRARVSASGEVEFTPLSADPPARWRSISLKSDVPGTFFLGKDGSLATPDGRVRETFVNVADGLEQSWHFSEAPAADGPLTIRVRIDGMLFDVKTKTGLHFYDPESGIGVRYGVARWIDAGGRVEVIEPSWNGSEIVLEVPASSLAVSYPAVLDPLISAESDVDEPVIIDSPTAANAKADAAFGDGVYLVAWWANYGFLYDLVAARVRASDGVVLDTGGLFVVASASQQSFAQPRASVAFDGVDTFLLVFREPIANGWAVYGRRVRASDGAFLEAVPIEIATTPGRISSTAVAGGDGVFLVAWTDSNAGNGDLLARRVASDGTLLDAAALPIEVSTDGSEVPSLAFTAGNFLVAWARCSTRECLFPNAYPVVAKRLRASDAAILDAANLTLNAIAFGDRVSIAADATSFFVTWRNTNLGANEARARRIDAATGALSTIVGVTQQGIESSRAPSAASHGPGFIVAWEQPDQQPIPNGTTSVWAIHAQRFDANLARLDGPTTGSGRVLTSSTTIHYTAPTVASGDNTTLLVYDATDIIGRSDAHRLQGTLFTQPDAAPFGPPHIRIGTHQNDQDVPRVASNADVGLVAWMDFRNDPVFPIYYRPSDAALFVRRVRLIDGVALDPQAILLDGATGTNYTYSPQAPAIGSDGRDFIVIWVDAQRKLLATRIRGADGALLDLSPNSISTFGIGEIFTAFGAGGHVILYSGGGPADSAGRVDPASGAFTGPMDVPMKGPLACDFATGCIAVRLRVDTLQIMRLDSARLVALDPQPIAIGTSTITCDPGNPIHSCAPAIAFDGTNYLVVFENNGNIQAQLLAIDGTELGGFVTVSYAEGAQRMPQVAFDGDSFLVVWSDERIGPQPYGTYTEVWGTRVSSSGVVLDGSPTTGGFLIDSTGYQSPLIYPQNPLPRIASGGAGRALVAYRKWVPDAPVGVRRIETRTIDDSFLPKPLGSTCVSPLACSSGECADGACCDSSCGDNDPTDCMACSAAAGGSSPGTCAPLAAPKLCRQATDICEVDAFCSNASTQCPPPEPAPLGTPCRTSTIACDPDEACDGVAFLCPPDVTTGGCPDPDAGVESDAGENMDAQPASDAGHGPPDGAPWRDTGPPFDPEDPPGRGCSATHARRSPSATDLFLLLVIAGGTCVRRSVRSRRDRAASV
jgi:hypothetical protein